MLGGSQNPVDPEASIQHGGPYWLVWGGDYQPVVYHRCLTLVDGKLDRTDNAKGVPLAAFGQMLHPLIRVL
mgnify:CR=1 FL=1